MHLQITCRMHQLGSWRILSSAALEMAMARSTFLLRFQEKCDDIPADPTFVGAGDSAVETGTRSRETNDQHASDTALTGGTIARLLRPGGQLDPESAIDPSWGTGTCATKSRETTDQHRADDAFGTMTKTAVREADDTDPSQRSYRTFSW